ncbi:MULTISPECIES: enoyl-CoA hydratase/isomerase family protein [Brevibacterium]|uniref:Enoyl-CoA hydratase n=1 Tax=Brevibacterium salitolerans TaxID=1403566 RepID=A0ABP5I3I2_9MICO|nr:enoyl-CoA hydratase/isomerase family protein [Brevibacterium sp.]
MSGAERTGADRHDPTASRDGAVRGGAGADFAVLEVVERELRDGVLYVRMNRPEAKNALSVELRADLRTAFLEAHDDPRVRCLVLTGSGGSFSAGGDVKRMGGPSTPAHNAGRIALGRELAELLRGVRKPTLAAVEGHAVGAGFGLALATDMILVSESARFQYGFIKRGLAPDSSVPYLLGQQIGTRTAMYYGMTGEVIDAARAMELGIAVRSFAPEEFADGVHAFARSMAEGPTQALFATRKAVQAAADLSFAQTWDFESFASAVTSTTQDHKNSVAAFKAKTPVRFQGE